MGKTSFLPVMIFALCALVFTSCRKDKDDVKPQGGGSIVGKWQYSDAKIVDVQWTVSMPNDVKKMMEDELKRIAAINFAYMECTASGKMDFGPGYYVDTYVVDGNNITIYESGTVFYGTYQVTGNRLQLNIDFAKTIPEYKQFCNVFIVGVIFNRIGDSTRAPLVLEQQKGVWHTLVFDF